MKKTIILFALALMGYYSTSAQFTTAEYLDINKVKARYMVHGDMFWDPAAGAAAYEFPKGSGMHSGFASSFWVGGFNQSTNQLHIAAQTYRQKGNDYWPGPLDIFNGAVSDTIIAAHWNQIWKVNKSTIDSFLLLSTHTLANTHPSILQWPGRFANSANGAQQVMSAVSGLLNVPDREMAPFVDVNNDNVYNPLDGDYPDIKGEQMLWWIFNDNTTPHTESGGLTLKMEIHASAYACTQTGMENTTFLNYKLYNFSPSIFDSTVITFWNDIDLGYSRDDYIGFDSARRMGITYNSDAFDETPSGYGTSLTQKAAVIIKQPGDLANYRSPVGSMTFHNNFGGGSHPATQDPSVATDFYNYMTGSWKDGLRFRAGCDPRDTTMPISNYCFPDDPSIATGVFEVSCNRAPDDRRFLLSSAPFQFMPGTAPIDFTFAFINTDTGVNNSNFNELRHLADSAYKYADGCQGTQWPLSVIGTNKNELKVYPNPSNGFFIIEDEENILKNIKLYNSYGQLIFTSESRELKTTVTTKSLAKGVYFLQVQGDGVRFAQKIIIE